MIRRFFLPFLLCLFAFPVFAQNTGDYPDPLVQTRLISAYSTVTPGQEFKIGLEQQITPKWHTYWKNPGDSGQPIALEWNELPDGVTVSDLQWPTPTAFEFGQLVNYGYENNVVLPMVVTVDDDVNIGGSMTLSGEASWLTCKDICIPENAPVELTFKISDQAQSSFLGRMALRRAERALPESSRASILSARLAEYGGEEEITLRFKFSPPYPPLERNAYFFSAEWGLISHAADQTSDFMGDGVVEITTLAGEQAEKVIANGFDGVITLGSGQNRLGYTATMSATTNETSAPLGITPTGSPADGDMPGGLAILSGIAFAILGGVILNLMPCVFPVLSMKVLHLTKHRDYSAKDRLMHAGLYTAGILVSFAMLAAIIIGIQAGGQAAGWGFQLQSPLFVLFLGLVLFIVGLNLHGFFEISGKWTNIGSGLIGGDRANDNGHLSAFLTGILATIVATPCTAPFMGTAVGFALTQSPVVVMITLLSLGLGLALPYILLSAFPRLMAWMPKPGAWMIRFKEFLAYPMFLSAAWLAWVLAQQAGTNGLLAGLTFAIGITFIIWIFKYWGDDDGLIRQGLRAMAVMLVVVGLGALTINFNQLSNAPGDDPVQAGSNQLTSVPYSPDRLSELRAKGTPVFVNMTASWCITCLANERTTLARPVIEQMFDEQGIIYMKGDWTDYDPQITRFLSRFDRRGVPIYVFFPPNNGDPVVLPQLLTPNTVITHVMDNMPSNTQP
jgi:thiol:disulfide interchange protein DsbD